jgi:signal transduction histidine kinase
MGHIAVAITAGPRTVTVIVRDDGIGIEANDLSTVFDTFRHASNSPAASAGLGLGLNITRNLVGLHEGEISVQSEGPGKGTQVTVQLPLSRTSRCRNRKPAGRTP